MKMNDFWLKSKINSQDSLHILADIIINFQMFKSNLHLQQYYFFLSKQGCLHTGCTLSPACRGTAGTVLWKSCRRVKKGRRCCDVDMLSTWVLNADWFNTKKGWNGVDCTCGVWLTPKKTIKALSKCFHSLLVFPSPGCHHCEAPLKPVLMECCL